LLRLAKKYNMRADVKEANQDIVIQIAK